MKVFLNPGHAPDGYPDPGAVNSETGLRECDVALAVGKSAASYLNAAGVETELLQFNSLEEICEAANTSDADIFLSIHCNAAEAEEANGTETWACAAVAMAAYWPATSRASWSMPSIPLTVA
jgi:N-acetylmuramoyl-L-alanine amidase